MARVGGRNGSDTRRLKAQLGRALDDGRVRKHEAKSLVKTARKDGVTQEERKALKSALTRKNDYFELPAQQVLAKTAKFKPDLTPNNPNQVRAEIRRARFDGEIDDFEASKIIRQIKKDGVTEPERQQLRLQLDARASFFKYGSRETLETFLRDTEPVVENSVTHAAGFEIRGRGVRQSAIDEMTRIANELTAARPELRDRLAAKGHVLVVIPKGSKLTDLPEFAHLKGQKTFDGRDWDGVRGVANVTMPDGRQATAVSEENLSRLTGDGYGNESVAIHEIAHAIHGNALNPEEFKQIKDLFDARKAAGGPYPSEYGGSNEFEWFAEISGAYFSRTQSGDTGQTPEWIRQNDPQAFELLQRIYGPPRPL